MIKGDQRVQVLKALHDLGGSAKPFEISGRWEHPNANIAVYTHLTTLVNRGYVLKGERIGLHSAYSITTKGINFLENLEKIDDKVRPGVVKRIYGSRKQAERRHRLKKPIE